MSKLLLIAVAAIALLPAVGHADTGKRVVMYKAAKCGMIFTPTQAKKYHYACPISHGKMSRVMLPSSVAKKDDMKTMAALAPKKHM